MLALLFSTESRKFQNGLYIFQSLPQTNGVGDLHEPSPEPSADHDNVSYCEI